MASTRRRFLTTVGTAAAGAGATALGPPISAMEQVNRARGTDETTLSPQSLLDRHAKQQFRETAVEGGETATSQTDPRMPTQAEVESWYTDRRNWGRWGDNDQMGAINLITQEKSVAAASLVQNGRKVSMSRIFEPEQHFIRTNERPGGASSVVDYYGFIYHGQTITHIDALCHMWASDGM